MNSEKPSKSATEEPDRPATRAALWLGGCLLMGGRPSPYRVAAGTNQNATASDLNRVYADRCAQWMECNRENFLEEYDTIAECITYLAGFTAADIEQDGQACANAQVEFEECVVALSCTEYNNGDSDLCPDEYQTYADCNEAL